MKWISLAVLIACLVSLRAIAQSETPANTGQNAAANTPPSAADIAALYARHGGSLYQAQMQSQNGQAVDSTVAASRLAAASFFAVPPPKPKVYVKHDLVTVIIREQSEFKSEGTTDLEKKADVSAAINEFLKLNLGNLSLDPIVGATKPKIDIKGDRSFKGDGSVDRKDSMTARVQAEVIDVKPNGNLVLAARKRIQTDDEVQTFLIYGVCRASDITPDNTVLSTQLYDFDLVKTHEGSIRDSTRRGWFSKLLDAANPF